MGYYPRLRDLREDQDLTQPQYCRYEQGLRDIPLDLLIDLADFYRTSTDYILGRTNNPAPPQG